MKRLGSLRVNACLYRLLLAWMVSAFAPYLLTGADFTEKAFYEGYTLPVMVLLTGIIWVGLMRVRDNVVVGYLMIVVGTLYCLLAVTQYQDVPFSLGCSAFLVALVMFSPVEGSLPAVGEKGLKMAVWLLLGVYTLWIGGVCCLVYLNHWTPNYDFGIFAQMFYYMRKTGLPLVTCERDTLLTHFAVHISPICYLLLPFYMLVPSPLTLQILQAAVVASGVIPLYLLGKKKGLKNWTVVMLCAIYVTYPAFIGGCLYYFHENNFLAPLILWMLYAFERGHVAGMLVSTLAVWMVKEDATVYTALICLYFFLVQQRHKRLQREADKEDLLEKEILGMSAMKEEKRNGSKGGAKGGAKNPIRVQIKSQIKTGSKRAADYLPLWLFLCSVLLFVIEVQVLTSLGNGAMTGRYSNYIFGEGGGLLQMLKTIFQNPIYVIAQCFSVDKIITCFEMFLPLGFLPLMLRYWEELALFAPFVLFNLMSGYPYQHLLGYQYFFGSGAILFYLAILCYGRMEHQEKMGLQIIRSLTDSPGPQSARASITARKLLTAGLCCSIVLSACLWQGKVIDYFAYYARTQESREACQKVLDQIPKEATVIASAFFVPELSQRDIIYELNYTHHDAEYVAIDLRGDQNQEFFEQYLADADYELIDLCDGEAALFGWAGEGVPL